MFSIKYLYRRMEKTLQHEETAQCFGLPPTGSGNHRPDGPGTGHALTFKVDHSNGADHQAAEMLSAERSE